MDVVVKDTIIVGVWDTMDVLVQDTMDVGVWETKRVGVWDTMELLTVFVECWAFPVF